MPRLNPHDLEDYLEDREPKREVRKQKKKALDSSQERRPMKLPKTQEQQ